MCATNRHCEHRGWNIRTCDLSGRMESLARDCPRILYGTSHAGRVRANAWSVAMACRNIIGQPDTTLQPTSGELRLLVSVG